jgi:hypothetical protein
VKEDAGDLVMLRKCREAMAEGDREALAYVVITGQFMLAWDDLSPSLRESMQSLVTEARSLLQANPV